ncbi:MAG: helix-turn-helix domain-containing protein [Clostridia bacterium]|nr:helix-turn-helix domain-containing protein [Clostridia bacterium]
MEKTHRPRTGRILRHDGRFHRRFFVSYMLILLVPLLVFPFFYQTSIRALIQKEEEMRKVLLEESCERIDAQMLQIDNALRSLEKSTSLPSLLQMAQPQEGSKETYMLYRAQNEMTSLLSIAGFTPRLSLYLFSPDLAFDGTTLTWGMERFYEINTSFADMEYATFRDEVLGTYHAHDIVCAPELIYKRAATRESAYLREDGILYCVSLPQLALSRSHPLGMACVHIGRSVLDAIASAPVTDHGITAILDREQRLIYGIFGEKSDGSYPHLPLSSAGGSFFTGRGRGRALVLYTVSPYNGWVYLSVSPLREIAGTLSRVRGVFYLVELLALLLGLVLGVQLTRRNAAPLESMLKTLRDSGADFDSSAASFALLEEQMKHMLMDNSALTQALEAQRLHGVDAFLSEVLDGSLTDEEQMRTEAAYFGLSLAGKGFGCMVLSFRSLEDTEAQAISASAMAQFFARHLSLSELSFGTQTHVLAGNTRLAVLLFFPDEDPEVCRASLTREFAPRLEEIRDRYPGEVRCCAGSVYASVQSLSVACTEALSTLEIAEKRPVSDGILFFDDVEHSRESYFYPEPLERKLKAMVEKGQSEAVEQFLDYIFSENLERRSLVLRTQAAFLTDMQTGIFRIKQELGVDIHIHGLFHIQPNSLDVTKECERIRDAYRQLLAHMDGREDAGDKSEETLKTRLESYVLEHYASSMLCISMAAEAFHMSDSYFASTFKREMGQTFGKYLENVRMQRAKELLTGTEMTIEEVAERTGYASSLSFRRAFKKVQGVTPSMVRGSMGSASGED